MVTKGAKTFGFVWMTVLFLTTQTAWGEALSKDRSTQIIQNRLSEYQAAEPVAGPVAEQGLKGGGDLVWWFQGIENVVCVSEFVDVDGDTKPDVLMESYDSGAPAQDHFF